MLHMDKKDLVAVMSQNPLAKLGALGESNVSLCERKGNAASAHTSQEWHVRRLTSNRSWSAARAIRTTAVGVADRYPMQRTLTTEPSVGA